MKKITAALACAMIVLSLAGCSKNEGTPESSPNSSNTESSDKGESSYSESVNSSDESKPEESKPSESKPDESKPNESKPSESKPDESKPTEGDPTQNSSTKPQSSSAKPQSSSSKPQSSSTKPQSSSTKPQSSSTKPQSSSTKPQSSSTKPQSSSTKPQSSSTKPQSSSTKPQSSSAKPQSSSSKPQEQPKPVTNKVDWSNVPVVDEMDLNYMILKADDINYNRCSGLDKEELKKLCSGGAVLITDYLGNAEYIKLPDQIEGISCIFIGKIDYDWGSVSWGNNAKAIKFSDSCVPCSSLCIKGQDNYTTKNYEIGLGTAPNVTEVVIPESWKNVRGLCPIPSGYGFPKLKTFDIPKEATRISDFTLCKDLKSITIPETVEYIGSEAFAFCNSLETVNFPKKFAGNCVIDVDAFTGCLSLKSVEIPEGVVEMKGSSWGNHGVFRECTSLTKVSLPSTLKEIPREAFSNCKSLTEVKLPSELQTISALAFANCKSLGSIDIPDSVTKIETNAFTGCPNLSLNYKGKTYNANNVIKLYNKDLSTM